MARTETAGELITQAQQLSDQENSEFISTAEWYRKLNVWTARLWNKLVKADPDRYTREETFTASGTTTDFEVAADYYGTVGLDWISSTTDGLYLAIPRLVGDEQNSMLHNQASRPLGYTFRYNATTPSTPLIRILPPPSENVRHRYIVAPPKYATDGTDSAELVAGIAGFEEYVVIGMAIDAGIKEKASVVQLRQSMAIFEQELDEAAENRSIGSAGHVTHSRTVQYPDPASIRWGTGG